MIGTETVLMNDFCKSGKGDLALKNANLGKKLKKARNAKGLTGEQLAELVNLTPESIWQLEGGKRSTTLPTLIDLCHALDTLPSTLLSDDFPAPLENKPSEYIEFLELIDKLSPDKIPILEDLVNTTIKNRALYRKTTL